MQKRKLKILQKIEILPHPGSKIFQKLSKSEQFHTLKKLEQKKIRMKEVWGWDD